MDFKDRITSGVQQRPMRNLIYGPEKIGKSTFASTFPQPITLSAEDGTGHIDTNRFVPANYNDAIAFMNWLYTTDAHGYKTLNVDSAGWLEQMVASKVCADNNVSSLEQIGYGKWKRMLIDEFENAINWFTALYSQGMHINIIAHAQVKPFSDPEGESYDRYSVQMAQVALADRLKQWADNIMFLNYDTVVTEKQEGMAKTKKIASLNRRLLHCKRTIAYDAGSRMGLPDIIEISDNPVTGFEKFWSSYQSWIETSASASSAA